MSTVRRICKDVAIIGAGAAGMMCAIEAGKRGRRVILIDHARQLAEKFEFQGADVAILLTVIVHLNISFLIIRIFVDRH